ncbi:hypothetical protein AMAG_02581 [Allomyces macrogynus ATCC 38327]|uniref:Transcription elongation factor SPT4 n=1 Tax=Allomyces macrogynus (strain ATCC 38327) TaxID=578462 RepID=A0A0L0S318_ALLM3|nr:transcription elongation factor spt4 [Allomyces javanicus]KAJ3371663.1 transcription elongation factor spt4 [Allomyces arbusculus]KNE56805.1 hypothetical protein AMAG_02581 [Allomyces macrogynus ATCC 38327]|eukprot:KNE56805.1 hypothetical protein AMAG_02581 [Allomyces macrogynus ATCC 38327]
MQQSTSQLPKNKRDLRACKLCSLIKTLSQFKQDGCDNCEEILDLRRHPSRVAECTSSTFEGAIAMLKPERSWVAKWQRVDPYVPGLYAIRVSGRIPEDIEATLEQRGIRYRPRDGTAGDL